MTKISDAIDWLEKKIQSQGPALASAIQPEALKELRISVRTLTDARTLLGYEAVKATFGKGRWWWFNPKQNWFHPDLQIKQLFDWYERHKAWFDQQGSPGCDHIAEFFRAKLTEYASENCLISKSKYEDWRPQKTIDEDLVIKPKLGKRPKTQRLRNLNLIKRWLLQKLSETPLLRSTVDAQEKPHYTKRQLKLLDQILVSIREAFSQAKQFVEIEVWQGNVFWSHPDRISNYSYDYGLYYKEKSEGRSVWKSTKAVIVAKLYKKAVDEGRAADAIALKQEHKTLVVSRYTRIKLTQSMRRIMNLESRSHKLAFNSDGPHTFSTLPDTSINDLFETGSSEAIPASEGDTTPLQSLRSSNEMFLRQQIYSRGHNAVPSPRRYVGYSQTELEKEWNQILYNDKGLLDSEGEPIRLGLTSSDLLRQKTKIKTYERFSEE
jgi:hypothetical protein